MKNIARHISRSFAGKSGYGNKMMALGIAGILSVVTLSHASAGSQSSGEMSNGALSQEPALEVLDESYIPDSVRKKYNLPDDWNSPNKTPDMGILTPEPLPLPAANGMTDELPAPLATSVPVTPVVATPIKPQDIISSWRARKGENVQDILRRWSQRESVDLMWTSAASASLKEDFSYVGKFQDAVTLLLQKAGLNELSSQFRSEDLSAAMIKPSPAKSIDNAAGQKKDSGTTGANWSAPSGAPLVEVLRTWAEQEGATVMWQTGKDYTLKESISQSGSFEDAIYSALNQYEGETMAPVGEISRASDGRKILVIRTDAPLR